MNRIHGLLLTMIIASLAPMLTSPHAADDASSAGLPPWPHEFRGRPLYPVAFSEAEKRFLADFPGVAARFSDGESAILMRWVTHSTRRLHPAEDCYRGWGFAVGTPQIRADRDGSRWRCFTASRSGETREVCEQIRDSEGRHYTDVSSWYWAATLDPASRPWLVTTVATPLPGAN
jgi:hypothetical protein